MLQPAFPEALSDGIIDGRAIAQRVRGRVRFEVDQLRSEGHELKLVVVRVGEDPASAVYVKHKIRACAEVGIESVQRHIGSDVSEDELLGVIDELNADDSVDGVLVQLPLPAHIRPSVITGRLSPSKDADGFHPDNLGRLFSRYALLEPCTPTGIMTMLHAIGCEPKGKHALVVGRSVIVGRPVSDMLLRAHATVTVCHRHTEDLQAHVERADIVVVAAGVPGLVHGEWIKEGAIVIDVGINRRADGTLCGDVDFEAARERALAITPVPGGVGPMTVAMLLWNTLLAGVKRRLGTARASELRMSLFDFDRDA